MRLINADAIEINEEYTFSGKGIKDFLNAIPTAYDVDKVVEQLKENSFIPGDRIGVSDLKIIMAEKAVEIVKSGGVSE